MDDAMIDTTNNAIRDTRTPEERRVDNIIASWRLEGIETPVTERERLLKAECGEISHEEVNEFLLEKYQR